MLRWKDGDAVVDDRSAVSRLTGWLYNKTVMAFSAGLLPWSILIFLVHITLGTPVEKPRIV